MKRIAALFVLIIICLLAFSCSPAEPEATTLFSGTSPVAEDGEGGFSLYTASLSKKLTLYNTSYESIVITVYSDNGKSLSISADKGEKTVSDGIGGRLCAASLELNGMKSSYALSSEGIEALLSSSAEAILVAREVNIEGELIIGRPVTLHAAKELYADAIYYKTDEKGSLKLSGNISCSLFASSAPNSHIEVPSDIVPENTELYICAASLNGEELQGGRRIVRRLDELELLASLPSFYRNQRDVLVLEGMSLTEPFTLSFPCLIDATDASLGGNLRIETEEKGNIRIWGDIPYTELTVEAPQCSLEIEDVCRIDEASKHFHVKSYNGYDIELHTLGGDCSDKILSATLKAEGNLLTEDITWRVSGKKLIATVNGVCAPSLLKNADLSFKTENGGSVSCSAAGKGEDGIDLLSPYGTYVTLTDKNGGRCCYRMITRVKATLPVVIIETDSGESVTTRFEYVGATMAIEADFAGLEGAEKTAVQIKGRGNSTWAWSNKTPYKVKYSTDVSLLGMKEGKEWVLLANYTDKSLIRNTVALEAAKSLDNIECYATQYPVDVFFGGEYVGVYTLGEQIEVDEERVSLIGDATDVDTGFFLEVGGTADVESLALFSTRYLVGVEILEPNEDALTDKHKTYIKNYVGLADEAVRTLNGYEDYIDVDALIDWFILTEISFNSDGAMRRSVFIKKDHAGKLEVCSVWDYDIAFGNAVMDYNNYEAWCCLATDKGYVGRNWMCSLMEDEEFVRRLRERWIEVREPLREAYMTAIDESVSRIGISADANFKVWDIMDRQVAVQPPHMLEYDTYEKQVEYLRSFINDRMDWIDSQLCSEEGEVEE